MQRVLFVLSEYGYWGEELIGPKETLEKAGYILDNPLSLKDIFPLDRPYMSSSNATP